MRTDVNATKERRFGNRMRSAGLCLLLTSAVIGLSACGNSVQLRGNTPEPEDIAEIQLGIHSRQDVIDLLGSPSTVSTFEDRRWYYIGQKTQEIAFMKPEVLDRSVLVITFDEAGLVESTSNYSLADAQDVDPVERVTPNEGRDLTLIQQLFGNIGKFSSPL